jgi:hypothetical protein
MIVTFISIHFVIICDVLLWRTYETHPALSLKSGCDGTEHCQVHTGQSGAPKLAQVWLILAKLLWSNLSRLREFPSA